MSDVAAPAPVYVARGARPADVREIVLSTWRGNLGDAPRMAAKFDWFYGDCPFGEPLLQLLAHVPSGADIGVAAAGPRRMLRDGVAIDAGVLVDLAVQPEHRSLGPALLLQQALIAAADARFDLLYGFPNPKAAPVFKRVGYVHLADCVRRARVVRHARYLARRVPRAIAIIAAPFVDAAVALRDRMRAAGDAKLAASWHDRIGSEVDALWQRTKPTSGVVAVRDREFLAWRFERGPLPAVRYLLLHARDGELAAWFATTREDGVLQVRAMAGVPMNPEEAFEALRLRDIEQLGQVRRAYIEQGGQISVLRWRPEETPPGLPLIPPWDLEQPPKWHADALPQAGGLRFCCANCGLRPDTTPTAACPHCDCDEWTVAVHRALEPLPLALTRIAAPIPEHA